MKNKLFFGVLLLIINVAALAEDKRSGFYIGLDASYETMSVTTPSATEDFGAGYSAILHAGYELPLGSRFAVLLGGTYDIDYYLQGGPGSDGTVFTKGTEKINQKIKWGLYAAPGVYLSDNSLLYTKLIYTTMKTDPTGFRTEAHNFSSIGYGIGYRHTFMQDNLITLEWANLPTNKSSFTGFKSGVEIAPNLTMLTLGWAKKF